MGVLDRYSVIPYDDGDTLLGERLTREQRTALAGHRLGKRTAPVDEQLAEFAAVRDELAGDEGIEVILGPDNPQWCTDKCLAALAAAGVPLHLHVQENPSQYARAVAATGMTPVRRLHELGLLRPDVTLAHLTHATSEDLELVAAAGTHAVLNISSNLRLGAGVPPIAAIDALGIPWGLGVDGGGLLDDLDLWHEARLAVLLSKSQPPSSPGVAPDRALAALTGGADALSPGAAADFLVIDAPPDEDRIPGLLRRVDARWVREVHVGGVAVVREGRPCAGALPAAIGARTPDPLARAILEPVVRAELDGDRPAEPAPTGSGA
jgi:cytosine/adenosine deaminase-related metal-dependent hydrolase